MNNEKKKDIYHYVLIIAFVFICSIAVAYASLASILEISSNRVVQTAQTWRIVFDTTNTTVNGVAGGTSTEGIICGAATVGTESISIANITLIKPEDKCTYAFTIKNAGTIDGILNSVVPTGPTSTSCSVVTSADTTVGAKLVCGNLTYSITSDAAGNTPLTTGEVLDATNTKDVYLIVKYAVDSMNATDVVQSGAKFTFTFAQK